MCHDQVGCREGRMGSTLAGVEGIGEGGEMRLEALQVVEDIDTLPKVP